MELLRTLVVDDEALARDTLRRLLARDPDIELVGDCAAGEEAVLRIRESEPDIVFLDVQMPEVDGFEVLRRSQPGRVPAIVFVTAYDAYALRAFEAEALDYLLKPFDDERFEQAFRRARRMIAFDEIARLRDRLLAVLQHAGGGTAPSAPATGYLERIPVTTGGETRVLPVAQIDYITASGPYARLHASGQRYVIREAMQVLEESLDPARFMRIHRSAIVRIELVESLRRGTGGEYRVLLRTGVRLRVSRSRREALERRLGIS